VFMQCRSTDKRSRQRFVLTETRLVGITVIVSTLVINIALIGGSAALADAPSCRQAWMPSDTPAFCSWENEPSLPEPATYQALATSNTHVYILGGYRYDVATSTVIYSNTVEESTIGANGHLSAWSAQPAFTAARSGSAAVSVGACLFIAGGSSSGANGLNYYADVQTSHISGDGQLSSWTTSPNRLQIPRSNLSLLSVTAKQGDFLAAVGGVTNVGPDTVHLDSVEMAKVGPTCTVGSWTKANYDFKGGRSTPQALVIRNNIVILGGWGDLDLLDVFNDIQVSQTRDDASPAPWRTVAARLPTGIYGGASVDAPLPVNPSMSILLNVGGEAGTGAYSNWISYAYVVQGDLAEAIGIWRIAPTGKLPVGRAGLTAFQAYGRLYVIGGNDASGRYYNEVLSARFDPGQP
jgi:hypothetical protein